VSEWFPGAILVASRASGYNLGRNRREAVKCHYTVGRNSYGIGVNGYFQWLITRNGTCYQFAEAGALCYDSGEWNDAGPGVEIEYHPDYDDVIFTPPARETARALARWLHDEQGYPLEHWGGDRISEFAGWRGFIDHADLIQREQHYDYWPAADVAYILGAPAAQLPKDEEMQLIHDIETNLDWLATANGVRLTPTDQVWDLVAAGVKRYDLPTRTVAWLGANLHEGAPAPVMVDVKALAAEIARQLPADADVDPRAIATAVRDEFAARPLS
jgi:hypothetical protein